MSSDEGVKPAGAHVRGKDYRPPSFAINSPTERDQQAVQQVAEQMAVARRLSDTEAELRKANEKLDSVRYKLGTLIIETLRHPGRNLWKLPRKLIQLRRTSTARIEQESHVAERRPRQSPQLTDRCENAVLFVPTNGAGLGHLTRCMGIADQMRQQSPSTQILFLTSSPALPILYQHGYLAYHIPPRSTEHPSLEKYWNELLDILLTKVIQIHRPNWVVFDGAYPYDGLRASAERRPELQWVWVKRGLYKSVEFEEATGSFTGLFQQIIVPGEIGDDRASTANHRVKVAPIVFQPTERRLSREDACRLLRLDAKRPVVYVQLGSGNINDIRTLTQRVVEALNRCFPNVQVVVGQSIISQARFSISGTYYGLRDFPNSIYFSAFDASVLAAGYNSVYEAVYYGLPTVFFPNTKTKTDDQVRRAMFAEQKGSAKVMLKFDESAFTDTIAHFLQMATERHQPPFPNGAAEAAKLILASRGILQPGNGQP